MVEFNLIDTTVYSLPSNNRLILFSGNPCFFKDRRIDMKPLVSFVKNTSLRDLLLMTRCILVFVFPVVFHRFCTYCAKNKANNKTIGDLCYVLLHHYLRNYSCLMCSVVKQKFVLLFLNSLVAFMTDYLEIIMYSGD